MITMKNTKAQMFAEIERLNAELVKVSNLVISRAPDPLADAQAKATKPMPQWQRERANQMARAKAQAMACGQTVKV